MCDCVHEPQTNGGTAGHIAAIQHAVSNTESRFDEPPAHKTLPLKQAQHLSPRGSIQTTTTNPLFGIDGIDWGAASNDDASSAGAGSLDVARGAELEC